MSRTLPQPVFRTTEDLDLIARVIAEKAKRRIIADRAEAVAMFPVGMGAAR